MTESEAWEKIAKELIKVLDEMGYTIVPKKPEEVENKDGQ